MAFATISDKVVLVMTRRVSCKAVREDLQATIRGALDEAGLLARLSPDTRVALKPNLTYPHYKRGVTTSPAVIRETLRVLADYTHFIAIVETDGGYGAWGATEAFAGHGLYQLRDEFGIELANLNDEPREMIAFRSGRKAHRLPLPTRLLRETDLFISMPVPKIHCMTGLSLGYKNQWGCVPDIMRLRLHHVFDDAIVAINRALKPAVLADGTYFLDKNGPMEGEAVRMDLVIAASDVGAFDRYVAELMEVPWQRIGHLRRAVAVGDMPESLTEIHYNMAPSEARGRVFRLHRTLRNLVALAGFRSRFLTWLGYESWFGRTVLHSILYAIAGNPVKRDPISTATTSKN